MGVPVCTIALIVYPLLIALAALTLRRSGTRNIFFLITVLASMGLMLNLVYIYNEFAYIQAVCVFCIVCTFLIAANMILGVRGYFQSTE